MYWEDLLIERPLSTEQLGDWLRDVFDVRFDEMVVAAESARAPISDDTAILAEYGPVAGEFPFHVQIFTRRDDLDAIPPGPAVDALARRYGVRVLLSDDTRNPYRMILLSPDGSRRAVHLDVDAIDDHDSYVIASFEEEAGQA